MHPLSNYPCILTLHAIANTHTVASSVLPQLVHLFGRQRADGPAHAAAAS